MNMKVSYKTIQVKSSINNFTKGEIFNWFKSLIRTYLILMNIL